MPRHGAVTAKHTAIDGIKFDSKAEAGCYQLLKKIDHRVNCQVPVTLFPKNGFLKAREWRCDFYLPQYEVYVEYKGLLDREFRLTLHALAHRHGDILGRMLILSNNERAIESINKFCPKLNAHKLPSTRLALEKSIKQTSPLVIT